uniref:Bromo domain-containing protein n=1 Tax=Chenopodium quinoa TaxID=63459 RepID=A0A803KLZ4_CHEQI
LQKRIKHSSLNNNDKNDVVNDADNNAVEGGGGGGGEDLRIKPEENAAETGEKGDEPEKSSVEKVITADSAENRSSNSTNHPKTDNIKPVSDSARGEPGAVRVERKRSEPVVGDNNRKVNRLSESLSESRRESTRQQSSDVQSSASLSKKKRRRFRGDNGDELEAEELSPANKRINAKSQPLIRFLESLRSHKHGSVFQRRLPSQETEKYRNVIRQHMDLDTVQSRLDKGIYCDCHPKFYRDLILTFTNAVLFYRKSTAEHIAAKELRKLKLLTRERSNLGNGGLRLSNSNGKKIISKEGNKREKMGNVGKDNKQESSEGERAEVMERRKINNADQKQEKGTPTPVLKKQGVAKFLKRMKQNSPSSQEKAGGNLKKNISKEVEVVNTTRRSSGRRGEKEAAASRKWIGRPPKRKAAMMSGSTPDSAKGGRSGGRDGGEKFKKKPRR